MAFFDTLKTAAKLTGVTMRAMNPLAGLAYDYGKKALQSPASPQPVMPQDGSMPQMGPMSIPQTPPTSTSFGAPVMPQVKAPVAPTYAPPVQQQTPGYTFKPTLSSAQVSSLQSLANKPQEQWTATDKANWAYGTNNGALPSARPPLPPMEQSQSQGQPGASAPETQPKPEQQPTPELPPEASPEARKAVEASQALYEKSLQISPEELSSQGDLDKLMESARKGFVNAQQQAIPMEFITGQLKSIEDRANALAEPLQTRLARLQAQRTASITASKFALDRADAKAAEEKAAAEKARQEKLAISKPIEVGGSIVQLNPKTGKYDVLYQAPAKPSDSNGFTLSPNQSRYENGVLVATAPSAPGASTPDVQTINGQSSVYDSATGTFKPVNLQQGTSAEAALKAKTVVDLATSLLNDPALNAAVGPLSSKIPTFQGNTADVEAKIEQLKSLLTLDNLGFLKGAMSDSDIKLLSSAATSLSKGMSEAGFRAELNNIIAKTQGAVAGGGQGGQSITPAEMNALKARFPGSSDAELLQMLGKTNVPSTTQNRSGMRTDRHNNPTAMTTDVARTAGLVEGRDYTAGDPFPNNPNLRTANLLGDPVATTIRAIDNMGFYTQSGKPRWDYIAMPKSQWDSYSLSQKKQVIAQMYQREGGSALKSLFA
jgi:hypothetical protein